MDRAKENLDDDYWSSANTGFDFDDSDPLSQKRRLLLPGTKDSNEYFRCKGLFDMAENKSSYDCPAYNFVSDEETDFDVLETNFESLDIHSKKRSVKGKHNPSEIAKNIVAGREVSLTRYRAKSEKTELLESAVKSHDGNAIITIILFLKSTLKKSIFLHELVTFPDAVNVYLSYLREIREFDEMENLLLYLGNTEEAAILKYEFALRKRDNNIKLKWIENCFSTHFQTGFADSFLAESVLEHMQLLSDQLSVEEFLQKQGNSRKRFFKLYEDLTGKTSVNDTSALDYLMFCELYYRNLPSLSLILPNDVKTKYSLTMQQQLWVLIKAFSVLKKWSDIGSLLTEKHWFGGVKRKPCVDFLRAISILSKANAPNDIIYKCISLVENECLKLELAKKYKFHSLVIERLKNGRDRLGLIAYKTELTPYSSDFCTITDILKNNEIKWQS